MEYHFKFSLDGFEHETLFDCLHDRVCHMREEILNYSFKYKGKIPRKELGEIEWMESHIVYIEQLMAKIAKGRNNSYDAQEGDDK
jgi:hypothetical protein